MGWITVSKDTQVLIPGTYACYLRRQGDLRNGEIILDYLVGQECNHSVIRRRQMKTWLHTEEKKVNWRCCSGLGLEEGARGRGMQGTQLPKREGKETDSTPDLAEGDPLCQHPGLGLWEPLYDFWLLECKRMNLFLFEPSDLCCFNPSVCGNLLHTHRKTNKQGSSGMDHRYLWRIRDLPEQQTIWGICYVGLFAWGKGMWREMRPVTWRAGRENWESKNGIMVILLLRPCNGNPSLSFSPLSPLWKQFLLAPKGVLFKAQIWVH